MKFIDIKVLISVMLFIVVPGHPNPDTRVRALEHLRSDLDQNMLDLAYTPRDTEYLLRNLLEWFNLPSASHESLVINFLIKLAQV